jgi:hypothetical protein
VESLFPLIAGTASTGRKSFFVTKLVFL